MIAEFIALSQNGDTLPMSSYIGLDAFEQELQLLQINVSHKTTVPATDESLIEILREAIWRSDLIFILGGLGIGEKRVTYHVLSQGLTLPLVYHEDALANAQAYFAKQSEQPPALEEYSLLPQQSMVFENPYGPFPGSVLARKKQCIFTLPERPEELYPLLRNHILAFLSEYTDIPIAVKELSVWDVSVETLVLPELDPAAVTTCYPNSTNSLNVFARFVLRQDSNVNVDELSQVFLRALSEEHLVETPDQPLISQVADICAKSKTSVIGVEYGLEGLLMKTMAAEPQWRDGYLYDLEAINPNTRKKVFGISELLPSVEQAGQMAYAIRRIEGKGLGLALCPDASGSGAIAAVCDGHWILVKDCPEINQALSALALFVYRFMKARPDRPEGAIRYENVSKSKRFAWIRNRKKNR